ncbi:MAG TPA: hypothetical protein VN633_11685 [Bryobacteraceae bacterium]|nr:hypothetical protein [Bryobacteraceae bacterium]
MKALWQALSLLAGNDKLRADVKAASDVEIREDQPTEPVDLRPQPTFHALQEIDRLFREKNLYLSAYELGEINRWVRYKGGVEPIAEIWDLLNLKDKVSDLSPDFMAAMGAMAIDSELRFRAWYEQTTGQYPPKDGTILENRGFTGLTDAEKALLTELQPGGKADNLCKEFFFRIWSGSPCTSLATIYPGWIHSNA